MEMRTKKFDCVEMKHKGADLVRSAIGNATPEEELEFWREGTEELRRRQEFLKRQKQ